jgi:hypothetical protein
MGPKESQPGAPQAAAHLIAGSLTRVDRSGDDTCLDHPS